VDASKAKKEASKNEKTIFVPANDHATGLLGKNNINSLRDKSQNVKACFAKTS
jgi:hypothetical protein